LFIGIFSHLTQEIQGFPDAPSPPVTVLGSWLPTVRLFEDHDALLLLDCTLKSRIEIRGGHAMSGHALKCMAKGRFAPAVLRTEDALLFCFLLSAGQSAEGSSATDFNPWYKSPAPSGAGLLLYLTRGSV
jgi:hypothetical protein